MFSTTTQNFKQQLPSNLIANILWFLLNLIIGLLLVPYFIETLGIAAYGLIPLATSIIGYVAIVVDSLNVSVSRFLTVDLQRGDYSAANRTFNTSLFGLSAIIAVMIPVTIIISWFIPTLFNVPQELESGIFLLFLGVSFAFLIRAWSGVFSVQLFAFNRLDLINFVNIIGLLIQTLLIIGFFTIVGPNLAYIGLAYFIGAVCSSAVSLFLAKRICPGLKISLHFFDRSRVHQICGMGWWVIINQIGALLFLQIDLIVVNLVFGATAAGEYAVALQWAILLRSIAATLAGVLTPIILSHYARNQWDALIQISQSSVKLLGLVIALPIGLICGFAPQLLLVWVGPDFIMLAPLMILLTAHLVINLAVLPLFAINVAHNKVQIPGLVTFFMGIGNFILAFALSLYTGLGYYGVALAGAIVLTLKNAIFTPWYASRILNISPHAFSRSMIPGILATILIALLATGIDGFIQITTLTSLMIAGVCLSLVYLVSIWVVGFSHSEREIFSMHLPANIRRYLDEIPCYCKNC